MINIAKIIKESFDNVDLLLCGGASGHMTHLFEDPDLTFKLLKDIFTKLALRMSNIWCSKPTYGNI